METIRLFDKDSFIKEFTTQVVSCTKSEKGFKTVLCQTAFFPEGGGQEADGGTIGDAEVLDVQTENGTIVHYTSDAVSGAVKCEIDWDKRFKRMQNHSGEHIVSGLIHKYTGFDNISFQLNDDEVSLGFSGELSEKFLKKIEFEANEAVIKNVKIKADYPDEKTLDELEYRSKLNLKDNVRIVEIEGYDRCACCAPHCKGTGQIGLIKIIDSFRYKGGTKIKIWCGYSALEDYSARLGEVRRVSRLLSAKQAEISLAVEKMMKENDALKAEISKMKKENVEKMAYAIKPNDGNIIEVVDLCGDDLREFAEKAKSKAGGLLLALSGNDIDGYQYVLTSSAIQIAEIVKDANSALSGRGGGRDNMARGTYKASIEEIKEYFKGIILE